MLIFGLKITTKNIPKPSQFVYFKLSTNNYIPTIFTYLVISQILKPQAITKNVFPYLLYKVNLEFWMLKILNHKIERNHSSKYCETTHNFRTSARSPVTSKHVVLLYHAHFQNRTHITT